MCRARRSLDGPASTGTYPHGLGREVRTQWQLAQLVALGKTLLVSRFQQCLAVARTRRGSGRRRAGRHHGDRLASERSLTGDSRTRSRGGQALGHRAGIACTALIGAASADRG